MPNKKQTTKENIFDLSKLVSDTNDVEIKEDSPEASALLSGYVLLSESEWENIVPRTHIRYLNKDGTMRKGGFVSKIWRKKDAKGKSYILIDLVGNYGKNSTKWTISSSKVEKIWKKEGSEYEDITVKESPSIAANATSSKELKDMKEELDYCKESIRFLTSEIQKIKNEQARTLEIMIKKLSKK